MKRFIIVLIIVVALAGLSLILRPDRNSQKETVRIGAILGLTGPYAFVGENYLRGIELAEEQYEKEHPNRDIQIIVENDEFDPKKGISAYEKLVRGDKVDALIIETSSAIDGVYDRATKDGLPIMQGGEQAQDPSDDNVIQIQPGYGEAETTLGAFVKERDFKNVAVFVQEYPAMVRLFNAFQKGYSDAVTDYRITFGEKDLRTPVLKALTKNPDALVVLLFPSDGAAFVKTLRQVTDKNIQLVFDANAQAGFSDYQKLLGDTKILDGSIISILPQKLQNDFVAAYRERFNQEAGLGSDFGFDALTILLESREKNGSQWIEKIKKENWDGVGGKIAFDEAGVRRPEHTITTIKNGEIE